MTRDEALILLSIQEPQILEAVAVILEANVPGDAELFRDLAGEPQE